MLQESHNKTSTKTTYVKHVSSLDVFSCQIYKILMFTKTSQMQIDRKI